MSLLKYVIFKLEKGWQNILFQIILIFQVKNNLGFIDVYTKISVLKKR